MMHVALLRGINVGGKNLIAMADLRACFEEQGYRRVRTYIQSGNVLFESDDTDRAALTASIGSMLGSAFETPLVVTVRSQVDLRRILEEAPARFGSQPDTYLSDVVFLMPPLTPAEVLHEVTLREGVDASYAGTDVVYFQRLKARASQSRLSRIASLPMYQHMTIRNWRTTTRLLALLEADAAD
jgi:uncharacterized protein (DUF1697 family)